VIYGKANLKGLYDKLGINVEIIKRGQNADFDTSSRPMSDAARKKLREGIFSTYQAFLERVAEGRKRKVADIEPLAQGRVWMGAQAQGNGLVDQLGGLDLAIDLVRQRAKIPATERIRLVPFPPKRTLFDQIFNSNESVLASLQPPSVEAAAMTTARKWMREVGLEGFDPELLAKGGLFCLPSFSLRIR
jgi:protease-4